MAKRRISETSEAADPPRVVLIDANVFFAPRLRDLVMHLHEAELINVHWTKEIEHEWTRNVVAKHGANPLDIRDCLNGMRDAADGWEVAGYAKHQQRFVDVDAKDRHVAAAAYKLSLDDWPGQQVALVTKNTRDFPQRAFTGTSVRRYSLGGYIDALHSTEPDRVAQVAEGCRRKLKHPPLSRERYVAVLLSHGCTKLARALSERWSVECPVVAADGTLFYESERRLKAQPKKKTAKKRSTRKS